MCRILSGIITKGETVVDFNIDNHEDLIKKAGLKDETNSPEFVRVEIIPIDGNLFNHDPKNWQLHIDQDFRPEWFSEEFAESEMRKALGTFQQERFIINRHIKEIKEGRYFVGDNGVVQNVWGNGVVQNVRGNGVVQNVWDNGVVQNVWGNGVVQNVWGNGVVQYVGGNGVVRNVWGNGVVQNVGDKGVVQNVGDNGVVRNVWDNGHINLYNDSGYKILSLKNNASVKDLSGDVPRIIVANPKIKLVKFKIKK